MEEFKSTRGPVRLASTESHVVIVDDEWTPVVDCLVADALAARLIPKSLYNEAVQQVKKEVTASSRELMEAAAESTEEAFREFGPDKTKAELIMIAMSKVSAMVEAGKTETEGGNKLVHNGRPMVAAVSEIAGFKVSGAEIDEAIG
jgi:hypothetical protein